MQYVRKSYTVPKCRKLNWDYYGVYIHFTDVPAGGITPAGFRVSRGLGIPAVKLAYTRVPPPNPFVFRLMSTAVGVTTEHWN
jgi:hypothetical protein